MGLVNIQSEHVQVVPPDGAGGFAPAPAQLNGTMGAGTAGAIEPAFAGIDDIAGRALFRSKLGSEDVGIDLASRAALT